MKNKKAAMEMSVGTIVTIVLLMSVLVLGLVLVRSVFRSSSNAVDQIDNAVQNEITKLFAEEDKELIVYPTSRTITLRKGDDPAGFAFSVENKGTSKQYSYTVYASDVSNCGSGFSKTEADSYLLGKTGQFTLERGASLSQARLVRFAVPETAPPCTIVYDLKVEGVSGSGVNIFVTIK